MSFQQIQKPAKTTKETKKEKDNFSKNNSNSIKKLKERRQQVASLLSKSFNEYEIAQQMGISQPTVCRDIKALKRNSQEFIFDLAKNDLSYYFKQSLTGLDEANKQAWLIFDNDSTPVREKLLALKLCIQSDEVKFRLLTEGHAVLAMKSLEMRLSRIEGMGENQIHR